MAVKIEPPCCAGPSCAPTIENALYSSDPFHFGNFRSCNMLQTFPVSPFTASLSQKQGGRGYWSYQLKFTAAGPKHRPLHGDKPARLRRRPLHGVGHASSFGARSTGHESRFTDRWALVAGHSLLLSPISRQSFISSHLHEERWHERPALHGGTRRNGDCIIWELKGIAGGLRKRVEN